MTATVDTSFLASAYDVPESTFTTLIDAPSADLVETLLRQLIVVANEFENTKAEKLKTDVELESLVRVREARSKQMKETLDNNLKEIETLRRQLNESEHARASVESNLHNLKSSSSNSSSELQTLQSRISTLEASNRDIAALLDSKSASHDALADELKTQQVKIITLRREVSDLEEKLQKSDQSLSNTKFREQNLQHEIELLKKNNDYLEDEVKRKSNEYTKYRKEKTSQIAQLQRSNEEYMQQVESLKRSEGAMRNRVNEGIRKLEEAYAKIESIQSDANQAQESFRLELENAHRLSELQKQSADTARARLQEVQEALDRLQDTAADEVGQLQAELDTERTDKDLLEQRLMDLEGQVESLESDLAEARQNATPRRNVNGTNAPSTPRGASPFATPASSRFKSSISMTQLYSENTKLRAEIETERQRNAKLATTVDEMIRDLEKQQPGIEELRLDHSRIQSDLEEMSNLLDEATKDRDATRKEARKLEGQVSGLSKESELLRQQIRDLGMQIKVLLTEAQAQALGMENLDPMDQALLEQAAKGEIDVSELDGMTASGVLISQRLTVFRNAEELQEKNLKLLDLTRRMAEEMEGEEAVENKRQHERDEQELQELRELHTRLENEVKSLNVRSESYIRERDMFRRMLAHRGQLPADGNLEDTFAQSTTSLAASTGPSASESQTSKDLADYNRLLKELQSQYDSYRQESATDQAAVKNQLNRISKEKSDLQSEVSRASSQLTLAGERYEMLQSTFNMLKAENTELQKRSSSLAESANRQEIRVQQVAEDLVEARSLTDGLRNENANLKAERELWKKIEARLGEDNRQLLEERSRLNKMLSDLQSLQNERELADSETRRRLQTRSDNLEAELQNAKRKLEDSQEEVKNASQRRDYDHEQSQTRIDDLLKSLSNTREELVAAKTTRDQLQARVDELKIELRNAEEKTLALQPRLTSRPTPAQNMEDQENQLTIEQELGMQNADLRRDLELVKGELQQANQHVEQYKEISQAAEDELQNLTNTHDQFQEEMDRIAAEKDVKIQDLEKRVEEISSELATTNSELSELRTKQDEASSRFNDQKAIYESENARLRDETERLSEMSKLHQADLRAQAEIAQRAQQSYEEELVKHAEAAKQLQSIRSDFNELKTQIATFKAEADSSKATLQENEEIWAETRSKYEQEMSDLKTRREDVNSQNNRLHQQLEALGTQITALKHARPASTDGDSTLAPSTMSESNREDIVNWLKKEKEIVEVQLELSKQEAKRYKQRFERTQSNLDETTEKLSLERQSQTDREQTAMSHSKLMESINQLNLFRESNASLRNEARQAQAQLVDRTKRVEELTAQIDPLRARVRELENDVENKDGEIKLLQEDRDRWQKRAQDILQKYDRVDPAELEALKAQVESLQTERDALVKEKETMQEEIAGIDTKIQQVRDELTAQFEERRGKLIESAKEKARQQNRIIQEKTGELDIAQKELADSRTELENVRSQLSNAATISSDVAMGDAPAGEEGEINQDGNVAELQSQLSIAQGQSTVLETEASELRSRVAQLESRVNELENELVAARNDAENLQNLTVNAESGGSEELEALRSELVTVKEELELARINAQANETVGGVTQEQIDELVAQRRIDLESEFQAKVAATDASVKQRSDQMKEKLNSKLKELRQKDREELESQMESLKTEHASEIERIKAEHSTGEATTPKPAGGMPTTEAEIKRFIATNPVCTEIIKRNVGTQVKKTVDAYEQRMAEAAEQSKISLDNAIALEQKRQNVKLTMTDKRAKDAQAKIEVVSKAATETPERAVGEVWTEAKDVRAAIAPPAPLAPASGSPAVVALVPATNANPFGASSIPSAGSNIPAANPFGQSGVQSPGTGFGANPFASSQGSNSGGAVQQNPFGQPAGVNMNGQQLQQANNFQTGIPQTAQAGSIPRPASRVGGAGPAARVLGNLVNNAQQPQQGQPQQAATGIPRPGQPHNQQGQGRGASNLPRGGGSAIPRGGGAQRGRGQGRGRGAPNLDPGARQFMPTGGHGQQGSKRPNDGAIQNVDNKRTRGS